MKKLFTISELADALGVTRQTIHKQINRGKINVAFKGINTTLISNTELTRLLDLYLKRTKNTVFKKQGKPKEGENHENNITEPTD